MISYIVGDKNVLADSMSHCKRLMTEQKLIDALHLVLPYLDEDSIGKIEGYFNVDSGEFDPVFSELECSGLQDSDFSNMIDCYVNLPKESLAGENSPNFNKIYLKNKKIS